MMHSVDIHTSKTAPEVVQTITAATERETVPFIFAYQGPAQPKPFVSKVRWSKVRVWKTPPRSKASSRCYPYFRGEVREVNGERHLVGSFALHPFHLALTSIPIAMAALVLWLGGKTVWGVVFIAALGAFEFITLASLRRHRPLEEKRIVVFLDALFAEPGQSPD